MTEPTLLVGGRVYTGRRYVRALLVDAGRVVSAGTEEEARRTAPTGTERVDLAGDLVVPALADAHLHLGDLARSRFGFHADGVRSIRELVDRLAAWAEAHPGGPVVGSGLDWGAFAERRPPTAAELDAVVPDRPVVLYHVSGHAAVVNTVDGASSAEVRPVTAPAGPAPGVVVEEELAALRPLTEAALPLSAPALERVLLETASLGVCSVGAMNAGADELRLLEELDAAGRLPVRVRAYLHAGMPFARYPTPEPASAGRLAIAGVKLFLDGAFGPRTAALDEPYADEPTTRGIDRGGDDELASTIRAVAERGLTVAVHAIGDRAVARAARLLAPVRASGGRSRIEHASLTPPRVMDVLRDAGTTLVVQPGFVVTDVWLRERLGPARARWAYAFRALADRGIPLAGSSDAPYDDPDPWRAMQAAVRRQDDLGRSANPSPDQALGAPEAFALYTTGAGASLGDGPGGTLEPGARADLLRLSVRTLADALRAGRSAIHETWVEGARLPPPGPLEL